MNAPSMLQHIPLSSAYLCEDCRGVGNCSEQCPACASRALMCLAGVLEREKTPPAYEVEQELGRVERCS